MSGGARRQSLAASGHRRLSMADAVRRPSELDEAALDGPPVICHQLPTPRLGEYSSDNPNSSDDYLPAVSRRGDPFSVALQTSDTDRCQFYEMKEKPELSKYLSPSKDGAPVRRPDTRRLSELSTASRRNSRRGSGALPDISDLSDGSERMRRLSHTAVPETIASLVKKPSTARPEWSRVMRPLDRSFDMDGVVRRGENATLYNKLPFKPPLCRGGNVFLDPSYGRVVRARRLERHEAATAQKVTMLLKKHETRGVNMAKGQRDPAVTAVEAEQAGLREQRVKKWLAVVAIARFIAVQGDVSAIMSMNVLRRLLGPVLVRVRARLKQRRMQEVLLHSLATTMHLPTSEYLRKSCYLLRDWPEELVAACVERLKPVGAAPESEIIKLRRRSHGIFFLDSGEVNCLREDDSGNMVKAVTYAERGTCFGHWDIVLSEPSSVEYRAGSRRVLYWMLTALDFKELLAKCSPDELNQMRLTSKSCRPEAIRVVHPITPQAMVNCGRNILFACWSDTELAQLAELLTPVAFNAGDVVMKQGDDAHTFYFVANGVVDIVVDSEEGSHKIASVGPWTSLGEEALIANDRRAASIVASTNVDLWSGSRSDLLALLFPNPKLYVQVKRSLASVKARRMESRRCPWKYFSKDPILQMLPNEVLEALGNAAKPVVFSKLEPLYSGLGGTQTCCMYLISKGGCTSKTKLGKKIPFSYPRTIGRGAILGSALTVLEEDWVYPITFQAQATLECWEISAPVFWETVNATVATLPDVPKHHNYGDRLMTRAKQLMLTTPVTNYAQ